MRKHRYTQQQVDQITIAGRVLPTRSVFSVASNDVDFTTRIGCGVQIWQYRLWMNMLNRCYSSKHQKTYPSYKGVIVCDEWLSFGNFLEWCNKEVGYKGKPAGMCLDKDIIELGNTVYCPQRCSFVPEEVNLLLMENSSRRGIYPVGVNYHKATGKFVAQISCQDAPKHLGVFSSADDAFSVYKVAKENQIEEVVFRNQKHLRPDVRNALLRLRVNKSGLYREE